MQSKKPQSSGKEQTDQYGRKQFTLNSNAAGFQPPKPLEKPPSLQSPTKSSKSSNKDIPPPEKRKLLQPVGRDLNPDELLGKTITITAQTEENKQSVFYCDKCKIQLQDSSGWFDHINGKKHNQMLGMSMVVERVSVDRVKAKLAGLKRKAETTAESIEDIERRLDQQEQEERDKKNKRRKIKDDEKKVEDELEFNEDDITAFGGEEIPSDFGLPTNFGSTKKK